MMGGPEHRSTDAVRKLGREGERGGVGAHSLLSMPCHTIPYHTMPQTYSTPLHSKSVLRRKRGSLRRVLCTLKSDDVTHKRKKDKREKGNGGFVIAEQAT